jgi:hypothetical protein
MKDRLLPFLPSHPISLPFILAIAGTLLAPAASAATVTGWQMIFDGDNDSSCTGGTAATASPVIADAHMSSIAANFRIITLTDHPFSTETPKSDLGTMSDPGGDTSLSHLVADFIATREGAINLEITGLAAGNYVFRSCHLDTFIDDGQVPRLGIAFTHNGSSPLVIELRSTQSNGSENFLLLNGFEIFQSDP